MSKDLKICMPWYKIAASIFAVSIFPVIRGVSSLDEAGACIQSFLAALSIMVFSDTYLSEVIDRRDEVFSLYPMRKKISALGRRILIQSLFLLFMAVYSVCVYLLVYKGLMLINPRPVLVSGYLSASVGTIAFWGLLSMSLANVIRNLWVGLGVSLLLWLFMNSMAGQMLFGKWSVCSYAACRPEKLSEWNWLCGLGIAIALGILMAAAIPWTIRRRGKR